VLGDLEGGWTPDDPGEGDVEQRDVIVIEP